VDPAFSGPFEARATVRCHDAAGFARLDAWADGVPVADDAEARRPAALGLHFERSVSLLLDPGCDLRPLAELVAPHQAHQSWSAWKIGVDGLKRRFVTQRCHGAGAGGTRDAPSGAAIVDA
jgi:hypothetical protein